jgi:hypothetical protein
MGVNGFELLKVSVSKGLPTLIVTAHAISAESLQTAIRVGAVSFLPKEKVSQIRAFLE